MDINFLKKISLRGRVAFSIRCFEYLLLDLGYDKEKWKFVLEIMWEFTNIKHLDDWTYKLNEISPDCLLEFDTYAKHDFEYLTKEDFYYLYDLYQNMDIDEKIIYCMEKINDIGSSHIYSCIIDYGAESFECLKEMIEFMAKNNLSLPNFTDFERFSINQSDGFGDDFDGKQLSIIL
ncbi:MAG: hypothetical protein R3Y63_12295 [Eubacteriales bacterium]